MGNRRIALTFAGDGPQRIDRFLAAELGEFSRSYIQKLIAEGLVTSGGAPAKASTQLHGGEEIEIEVPPPIQPSAQPEDIPLDVIFEDEHLIAVNKPPGLVVHPAPGHPGGTLVNALLAHCGDLSGIGGTLRPGIVHRLDLGTSGVIVAAKSDAAHRAIAAQFKQRTVEKTYLAVCFGRPEPAEGRIDLPIGRDRRNRKKISAATDRPRPATTLYSVEEDLDGFAYLTLRLLTGRTHQVRVHLAHIRHPIVGDALYAGQRWKGVTDARRRSLARDFGRPALHAYRLRIAHPNGNELTLEAPPPEDLLSLIDTLLYGAAR